MTIPVSHAIESLNGGQFVSPGYGSHATRVIDSYELIFVTQGRLDMFEGERSFHLARSQTLLLYPGVRHGGLLPYAPDVNFYWVHFRPVSPECPGASLEVPKVATVSDPEGLTELFCRYISDQESGILDPLSAAHLIALMLCMTCEEGQARSPRSRGLRREQETLAQTIHRHIEENYDKPISTSSIAQDLHYNPDYLERVFHSRWNMSIIDAVHQKRIGLARASLHTEPGKNINEIAFECGYTDAGYFRRMFKRLTGLTPREFRTLDARTHINTH